MASVATPSRGGLVAALGGCRSGLLRRFAPRNDGDEDCASIRHGAWTAGLRVKRGARAWFDRLTTNGIMTTLRRIRSS